MKNLTPEQIIGRLKSDSKYLKTDRKQTRRKLLKEGDFLLRPSNNVNVPDFEMFVMSYIQRNDFQHVLYGISKISGQCLRFEKKQNSRKYHGVRIVDEINYESFSNRFEDEITQEVNSDFNGLIISTQTPDPNLQVFPRAGGTAVALHHFTGLPFVQMHRNAQATKEEAALFANLKHEGIVFLTGHGSENSKKINGVYITADNQEKFDYSYKLNDYRDLILDNSQLKTGDILNIVLWCCKGAHGDFDSTAGNLARSFWEKGISTRILASKSNIGRFDGKLTDEEKQQNGLGFRTKSENDIYMVENLNGTIRLWRVLEKVFFGSTIPDLGSLLIFKQSETQMMPSTETHPVPELTESSQSWSWSL